MIWNAGHDYADMHTGTPKGKNNNPAKKAVQDEGYP